MWDLLKFMLNEDNVVRDDVAYTALTPETRKPRSTKSEMKKL